MENQLKELLENEVLGPELPGGKICQQHHGKIKNQPSDFPRVEFYCQHHGGLKEKRGRGT